MVGRQLHQRGYCVVAEGAIGLIHHGGKGIIADFAADERPQHGFGNLAIGLVGKAGDGFPVELRPFLRQVETAVAGKPLQQDITKSEAWSVSARTYKLHLVHRLGLP